MTFPPDDVIATCDSVKALDIACTSVPTHGIGRRWVGRAGCLRVLVGMNLSLGGGPIWSVDAVSEVVSIGNGAVGWTLAKATGITFAATEHHARLQFATAAAGVDELRAAREDVPALPTTAAFYADSVAKTLAAYDAVFARGLGAGDAVADARAAFEKHVRERLSQTVCAYDLARHEALRPAPQTGNVAGLPGAEERP